jgi:SAM-dependent methyltransferase
MHISAAKFGALFFEKYGSSFAEATVLDIGAQDVNGSLKESCPSRFKYIGIDFVEGKGVDVILTDPYKLPFEDASADMVVCSSCFEHSEMFWLVFLEVMRVLKPHGLFYLNVPSNGFIHRYPMDCWRFYPDSGRALVTWANRNGLNPALLESFTGGHGGLLREGEGWNDFVAVFVKDAAHTGDYVERMIGSAGDYRNGLVCGSDEFSNPTPLTQDQQLIDSCTGQLEQLKEIVVARDAQIRELAGRLNDSQALVQSMIHSRSWRITAPLRRLIAMFSK